MIEIESDHLQDVGESKAQSHSPGPPNAQGKRGGHIGLDRFRRRCRRAVGGDGGCDGGGDGGGGFGGDVLVGGRGGSHVSGQDASHFLHGEERQSNWGCSFESLRQESRLALIGLQPINPMQTNKYFLITDPMTNWTKLQVPADGDANSLSGSCSRASSCSLAPPSIARSTTVHLQFVCQQQYLIANAMQRNKWPNAPRW